MLSSLQKLLVGVAIVCKLLRKCRSQHSSNLTIKYNFKEYFADGEILISRNFNWGTRVDNIDITASCDLPLVDGYEGISINVDIERLKIDDSCQITICNMCHGSKFIFQSFPQMNILEQSVRSPCPRCFGLGMSSDGCSPYIRERERIEIDLPPGCRPGHKVTIDGKGNEIFAENGKEIGSFSLVVKTIATANFEVAADHVRYTLRMTGLEALYGFTRNESYLDEEFLFINRTGKLTMPGTSARLPGLGMPLKGARANDSNNSDISNSSERDDLVVFFELADETEEEEEEEEDDENDEDDFTAPGDYETAAEHQRRRVATDPQVSSPDLQGDQRNQSELQRDRLPQRASVGPLLGAAEGEDGVLRGVIDVLGGVGEGRVDPAAAAVTDTDIHATDSRDAVAEEQMTVSTSTETITTAAATTTAVEDSQSTRTEGPPSGPASVVMIGGGGALGDFSDGPNLPQASILGAAAGISGIADPVQGAVQGVFEGMFISSQEEWDRLFQGGWASSKASSRAIRRQEQKRREKVARSILKALQKQSGASVG